MKRSIAIVRDISAALAAVLISGIVLVGVGVEAYGLEFIDHNLTASWLLIGIIVAGAYCYDAIP